MLKCNGKTFMNLQEAVQWLLNNNALFFMCNEDYADDTEISLSELVNPSPANPKLGSLVLFADSKIATITGIDDETFTVGEVYVDLNPGKDVSGFSIDASQHLIVSYRDGTSEDLGPIFSGNVTISGNLNVTGEINGVSNPSVKPIYYHGIEAYKTQEGNVIYFHILNNSPSPLTSWDSVINWLTSYYGKVIVQCSGCMKVGSATYSIYSFYKRAGENTINMIREGPSGYSIDSNIDLATIFSTSFEDAVNKIN